LTEDDPYTEKKKRKRLLPIIIFLPFAATAGVIFWLEGRLNKSTADAARIDEADSLATNAETATDSTRTRIGQGQARDTAPGSEALATDGAGAGNNAEREGETGRTEPTAPKVRKDKTPPSDPVFLGPVSDEMKPSSPGRRDESETVPDGRASNAGLSSPVPLGSPAEAGASANTDAIMAQADTPRDRPAVEATGLAGAPQATDRSGTDREVPVERGPQARRERARTVIAPAATSRPAGEAPASRDQKPVTREAATGLAPRETAGMRPPGDSAEDLFAARPSAPATPQDAPAGSSAGDQDPAIAPSFTTRPEAAEAPPEPSPPLASLSTEFAPASPPAPAAAAPAPVPAPVPVPLAPTASPRDTIVSPPPPPPPSPADQIVAGAPWVVQILAVEDETILCDYWADLKEKQPRLFGEAERTIARKDLGNGRIVFRLRAGAFETRQQAAAYCRALGELGQDCFPIHRSN
jgi:hypothetical protein